MIIYKDTYLNYVLDKDIFMDSDYICSKSEILLKSLNKFYSNKEYLSVILPIIKQESYLSLRILDWLITNYSKKNNINYELNTVDGKYNFNMYLNYRSQLKAYSKKSFDPFCRRQRIEFYVENPDTTIEKYLNHDENKRYYFTTTVGQLNFFRWALQYRVIKYAYDNVYDIEKDMLRDVQERDKNINNIKPKLEDDNKLLDIYTNPCLKEIKRRERSKSSLNSLNKHHVSVTIKFNVT